MEGLGSRNCTLSQTLYEPIATGAVYTRAMWATASRPSRRLFLRGSLSLAGLGLVLAAPQERATSRCRPLACHVGLPHRSSRSELEASYPACTQPATNTQHSALADRAPRRTS